MESCEGVLVAAQEGFEILAVGELDVEHPAVGFDQAEGIELAFITLIIERPEVAPVDLEALAGTGFHAQEGAGCQVGNSHSLQVIAQDGVTAGIPCGLQALEDDGARGVRVLLEQFAHERLEGIELAGARTADR